MCTLSTQPPSERRMGLPPSPPPPAIGRSQNCTFSLKLMYQPSIDMVVDLLGSQASGLDWICIVAFRCRASYPKKSFFSPVSWMELLMVTVPPLRPPSGTGGSKVISSCGADLAPALAAPD